MKGAIAWFTENHVTANLLMIFLLLAGVFTGMRIKLEVFPETALDKISISTVYYGASPSEVEEAVIRQIEEKIAGLPGIKRIDSTAREGYGSIIIEVIKGWDMQTLLDEVKAQVDRLTTLPKESEKPIVREITRRSQVINLAIFGQVPENTLKNLAQQIKDDLTNLPGITLAEVSGLRANEIHIEIAEKTLQHYNLTLGYVAETVARSSLDLPAGSIKTSRGEVLIRTKGRRYFALDYLNIPIITNPDGSQVLLGQIAQISEGFEDVDLYARFKGKPAAIINVFRVADQNALEVADTVKKYISSLKPDLPAGVEVAHFADMSKILRSRLHLLIKNMLLGLLLVSILLGLFLNLRLAFWVTLGIPVSFMAGLTILPWLDVSINMISLFGFIMVLGIVVDDAIIVGENIFRIQENGMGAYEAAVQGTLEVGRPVIFSVLTSIIAFFPLLQIGGTMGKMIINIPLVVIVVLIGSLIESLFILPAHLARSKAVSSISAEKKPQKISALGLAWIIAKPYTWLVNFCIQWRYAFVSAGIVLLLLTFGIWRAGWIKFNYFPKVEGDVLECLITMPTGTPENRTMEVVAGLEKAANDLLTHLDKKRPADAKPLLVHSISLIGSQTGRHGSSMGSGSHLAQIWIQLLDGEHRKISSRKLSNLWRYKAGVIPDAKAITFKSELHSGGNPIEIHLSCNNYDQLIDAAETLKNELGKFSGVFDIEDSFLLGKQELQLKLKPAAASLGLTLNDLARQVRNAFYGAEALRFQRNKDEIKVVVRYPDNERDSLEILDKMRIHTINGAKIPFNQVAQIESKTGFTSITRAQRQRVIKVMADVDEKIANSNEIRQDMGKRFLPQLQNIYPDVRYTIEGAGKNQRESLQDITQSALIALFGIYALLAIPFKSFSRPLIVMLAIPFGIVGAIIGHLIMGYNLTIISLMGIVGLSGIVVNDSLILIYKATHLRLEGANCISAITQAGALRFRAIILTSLTTFCGLTPILLEKSIQARFLIPMAVSLGFGVLFATGITLLLIPCGYVILDDIHILMAKTGLLKKTVNQS